MTPVQAFDVLCKSALSKCSPSEQMTLRKARLVLSNVVRVYDIVQRLMGKQDQCVWCGEEAQGNYSIHRDGFDEGPELPLCDKCGGEEFPTCEQIWEKTSQMKEEVFHELPDTE